MKRTVNFASILNWMYQFVTIVVTVSGLPQPTSAQFEWLHIHQKTSRIHRAVIAVAASAIGWLRETEKAPRIHWWTYITRDSLPNWMQHLESSAHFHWTTESFGGPWRRRMYEPESIAGYYRCPVKVEKDLFRPSRFSADDSAFHSPFIKYWVAGDRRHFRVADIFRWYRGSLETAMVFEIIWLWWIGISHRLRCIAKPGVSWYW